MVGSLEATFAACRAAKRLALIPYLTGGFPSMAEFAGHLGSVARGGADIIEVGIPFSDPIADGPTIQYSSHVALTAGANLHAILETIIAAKLTQPIVIMSYLNPLLAPDRGRLMTMLRSANVRGMIIPDLPVDESADWRSQLGDATIDLIQMAAPTSTPQRLALVAQSARGFVYALSRTGTTGVTAGVSAALPEFLGKLRGHTSVPIAVGFGISRPEHVWTLKGLADGVIVGSRIVEAIRSGEDVASLVAQLRAATE